MSIKKRRAVVFPKQRAVLEQLGENIKLAYKRRRLKQSMVAERACISSVTMRRIERGDPGVSLGHYLQVLAVLGLAEDLAQVASDDELGRKLQDIELLGGSK